MGYDNPNIDGWMAGEELLWLYGKAQEAKSIIEIGCWKGRSTHALLSGCKGPVFAVDHFKGSPNELSSAHHEATHHDISEDFKRNVGHFKNLVMMRMDSREASKYFGWKSVDMVFIDGSHTPEDIRADIRAWRNICRRLLCGHDLSMIEEVLKSMKLNYRHEIGSIWSAAL